MLDPYALEETLRMERQMFAEREARRAVWMERMPRKTSSSNIDTLRRRLALALLALADRLDPRGVVSVPHVPDSPALNGTFHHA
jgi:hypothetical protein